MRVENYLPNFREGNVSGKFHSWISVRKLEASIPENGRERQFLPTPGSTAVFFKENLTPALLVIFVTNISFIQVTCEEPLTILKAFCKNHLDLLAKENSALLKTVQHQMPPFWNIISQILKLENKSSLSLQMSAIILRLLEIRDQTFKEAVGRNSDDYIDWDDDWGVPPLSYYPNHPKKKILRKYVVNHTKDRELCQKSENSSKTNTSGIFSFGCLCPRAITMGFELMKQPESPHNVFRFLMT